MRPTFRELVSGIIAIIIIVGGGLMIVFGHDGEVKALIGLVVGFYFGQYIPIPKKGK